ncbi:MAG TPA: phosphoribosylaminoimidazolesuccinocarboxamide synthase [Candidatus Acidoferrales bacterium]|nr:phosphoribosylaminoimidazolesuccinocarboxamide synthase [Candidatus Acidoferrales bacterium]
MIKGLEVARGKTKVLFEKPSEPDVLVVQALDSITAGDGARRNEVPGKGRIAAKTTARVFRLLNLCGLPTHYLSGGEDDDDNEMLVRRCTMIPLEVVVRGVAAGSLVKRKPSIVRGSIIIPRMVEFFLKDDANHDPLIEPDQIVARAIATSQEIAAMSEIARIVFEILAHAWRGQQTLLVDLKIEFGRLATGDGKGSLVIADVIDNDSWRIWPQGREELMLDKQVYRNLTDVTDADLVRLKETYERVAEMVGRFPVMRPGMAALIADGQERVGTLDPIARALGKGFGVPSLRRIASSTLLPSYTLQVVQQLDATFASIVYVAAGDDTLVRLIDGATPSPVIGIAHRTADEVALACAKMLAVDNSVLFGRVLLQQANARSAIVQADGQLSAAASLSGTLG